MFTLRKLWLQFILYYKGIRFYKTDAVPKIPEFKRAVFDTFNGHQVEFYFFREECEDLIFRKGKINKERFIGYLIQAKFDDKLPSSLFRYNNLKFFFNSKSIMIDDEQIITDALLHIFLDFIHEELKQEKLKS